MSAVIGLVVEAAFVLCFVAAAWNAVRHRDPVARDVALLFGTLASFLVVGVVGAFLKPLPAWLTFVVVALLLAEPALALRLVDSVRAVPRGLLRGVTVGYVVVTVGVAATLPTMPPPVLIVAIIYFVGLNLLAAGYLVGEAVRRRGSARIRLLAAAAATGGLAVSLLLSSSAGQASGDAAAVSVGQIASLLAALAYLAAFVPPRPLRRLWQATAASDYTRSLVNAPADEPVVELWRRFADVAAAVTGGRAVVVTADATTARVTAATGVTAELPGAFEAAAMAAVRRRYGQWAGVADPSPIARALVAATGDRLSSVLPLSPNAALFLLTDRPSLFGEDDLELLEVLGGQTEALVERRALLESQEALSGELTRTVAALEAASAAKSDFLSSMSHELRTPLNAIIGFSDLMREEPRENGATTVPVEWVEHIHRSGQHLLELINDVLDLAKVEAGRLELNREAVDGRAAAAEAVAGLRPLADAKHLAIEVEVPSLVVDVDRGRLRQILYNLLSNAIKFTPDGGRVTVAGESQGSRVLLTVSDTGVGIAPDDQAHVFEEFRQVGDVAQRQSGTGLGLALTRRLVEAHGGTISVVSALGVGSTFSVELPAWKASRDRIPDAPPARTSDRVPTGPAEANVLVIEDEPAAARLLREYLEADGYGVRLAPSGEAGMAAAHRERPLAIVLDVLLPGIDGWEVLRRLKSDSSLADVPIVIVTVVDEREVGLALGAADYLVKPIKREVLLGSLARLVGRAAAPAGAVRVLAVDDEPDALDLLAATLEPAGFDVRRADAGAEALDVLRRERFDLVICDLVMPGMDGFEVIAAAKADPATAAVPILVLTAHELSDADRARLNGRIVGVAQKGPEAAAGLRSWLDRATRRERPNPAREPVAEAAR